MAQSGRQETADGRDLSDSVTLIHRQTRQVDASNHTEFLGITWYQEKGRRVSQMYDQQARESVDAGQSLGTLVGNLGQPCGSSIFEAMTDMIFGLL